MGGVSWTKEEDQLLKKCIHQHGEGKWQRIPLLAGLNRCPKSCRLRWVNYLRPGIRRGTFAEEEIDLIIKLHNLLGNRWSLIAGRLAGRTGNDVKNYWNCHLSKKLNTQAKKEKLIIKKAKIIRPQPRYNARTTVEPVKHIQAPNLQPQHGESSSSTTLLQYAEVEQHQVLQKEEGNEEDDIMQGGLPIDFHFGQVRVSSESSSKWDLDDLVLDMEI